MPQGVQAGLVILKKIPPGGADVPHGGIAQLPLQDERHVVHNHLPTGGAVSKPIPDFKPLQSTPFNGKYSSLFESSLSTPKNVIPAPLIASHHEISNVKPTGFGGSKPPSFGKYSSLFESSLNTQTEAFSSALGGPNPSGNEFTSPSSFTGLTFGGPSALSHDASESFEIAGPTPLPETPIHSFGPSRRPSRPFKPTVDVSLLDGPETVIHSSFSPPRRPLRPFKPTVDDSLIERPETLIHSSFGPTHKPSRPFKPTIDDSFIDGPNIVTPPSGPHIDLNPNGPVEYLSLPPTIHKGFRPMSDDYRISFHRSPKIKLPLKSYIPPHVLRPKPPAASYGVPHAPLNNLFESTLSFKPVRTKPRFHPSKYPPNFGFPSNSFKALNGPSSTEIFIGSPGPKPHSASFSGFTTPKFPPSTEIYVTAPGPKAQLANFGRINSLKFPPSTDIYVTSPGPKAQLTSFEDLKSHFPPSTEIYVNSSGPKAFLTSPGPSTTFPFGAKLPKRPSSGGHSSLFESEISLPPSFSSPNTEITASRLVASFHQPVLASQHGSHNAEHNSNFQSGSFTVTSPGYDVVKSFSYELPVAKRQTQDLVPRPFEKTGHNSTGRT